MASQARPRRLAPLDPATAKDSSDPVLAGVVFDVDGTLCEPQNYMFSEMREALGISASVDILSHIASLPAAEQGSAHAAIEAIERRAMQSQTPQPGLQELMDHLDARGIRKGICTRNFDIPINHLLTTFLPNHVFSPILTRAFRPPKPEPAGILEICRRWGLGDEGAARVIMVGDSSDDMKAGRAAGCFATVLLRHVHNESLKATDADVDVVITRLDQLVGLLEWGTLGEERMVEGD